MNNLLKKLFERNEKYNFFLYILRTLLFLIFPFIILLISDYITREDIFKVFQAIESNSVVYLFSYLLISLIFSFLYLVIGRFSFFLVAFFFPILSLINHFKTTILDEPFYPSDIFIHLGASKDLLSFVKIKVDSIYIRMGIGLFLLCIFFFFSFKGTKLNIKLRVLLGILLLGLNIYVFKNADFRMYTLQRWTGLNAEGLAWRQKYNYDTNGFIAAFFINYGDINVKKPENYSEETINEIGKKYTSITGVEPKIKPNVIFILSEAFWDVTKLPNINFSNTPTRNFNKIKKDSITGNLISPTFGGKTALVEFEILTGNSVKYLPFGSIPYQQYIKEPIPSVVQEFKKNGYSTLALHTYEKKFFNRNEAYKYLGFDNFIGVEDLENPKYKGPFVSDEEFTNQVIKNFKNKEKGKPLFLFGITMQNHFPYEKEKYKALSINVTGNGVSKNSLDMLNTYSEGIKDADTQLKRLVDFVKKQKEPTIIVFFGDHLGSMGENYLTYKETGFISTQNDDFWTEDEIKKMYSTEFILWDNYTKNKEDIGNIGAMYLGNYLLDYIGFDNKNPYFNYLKDEYKNCFDSNTKQLTLSKKNFNQSSCEESDKIHQLFQYDILFGKKYIEKY